MSATPAVKLQPVRGMRDLFGAEQRRHAAVRETARQVTLSYGFAEIETPVLEFTEVFLRTLGNTSDVVTKEIYAFRDQGEVDLCLRPENTASVMRALVSNGLTQALPQRLFYAGPMFRRERPQKGRYRQFSQVGVELIGAPEPLADVEVIACGQDFLSRLGLDGQLRLEINTLGDSASRSAYRAALVEYFSQHRAALSPESQIRLTQNPLRILDSKQEADRALIAEAPRFDAYLNPTSEAFFAQVCSGLDALGIAYQRNPYLVRGLDYYNHTAFEFISDNLGAQGTVLAGGRYDGLLETMGGPSIAGIGWASGVDRLALLDSFTTPATPKPLVVMPLDAEAEAEALQVARALRRAGQTVLLSSQGKLAKRLKLANRLDASHAIMIGSEELARGDASVKALASGTQSQQRLDLLKKGVWHGAA